MTSGYEPLFDSLLPMAERWIEQSRKARIESLVVEYTVPESDPNADSGWALLPKRVQTCFSDSAKSQYRVADGRFMTFAYRGDMEGWGGLLGEIGRIGRTLVKMEPCCYLDQLDARDGWTFILFHLGRLGIFDKSLAAKPKNLNPGFALSIGGKKKPDARLDIDSVRGKAMGPLVNALQESAERDGWYAEFSDIRMTTVVAIRRIKTLREQANATGASDKKPGQPSKTIEDLERETPGLDTQSVEWVAAREKNAEKLGVSIKTLRDYRCSSHRGRTMPGDMFGIDRDGRRWRRHGTPRTTVYYYVPSLPKTAQRTVE